MKQISKNVYKDMVKYGFISYSQYDRNVTKTKNKYYVVEGDLERYLSFIRNKK